MSGRSTTRAAPLACPACGRKTGCRWLPGEETAAQQCPACGYVFEAAWPGFDFEPETVIVRAGNGDGDDPG